MILTVLRFIQGIGVGGEWGGSVLLAMEWARTNHPRLYRLLAAIRRARRAVPRQLAVLVFSALSGEQFLAWGWRIPFLLSIVLVGVGLYIRLGILETPVFAKLWPSTRSSARRSSKSSRPPEGDPAVGLRRAWASRRRSTSSPPSSSPTAPDAGHVSRDFLLTAVMAPSLLSFVTIPLFGYLSDRIGRQEHVHDRRGGDRRLRLRLFRPAEYRRVPAIVFLAIVLSLVPHDMMYGPQAALIAESFTGRLRYSGSSLGYQLASVIAGGPAPLIAAWLFAHYHWATRSRSISRFARVSLVATALMTDYTGKDI